MVCPNCKKELIAPGRFCGYCGAPLDIGDDDEMKTVMADDDIVTEELPQTEFDHASAVEEKTTLSTQSGDSNQTVELEHAKRMQEEQEAQRRESERENLIQQKRDSNSEPRKVQDKQERNTKKRQSNSKKRQKRNTTERLTLIMAAVAGIAVIVVVVLAARLIFTGKDNDWIVQLSELESTQNVAHNGTITNYQLDDKFERMSVKASIKPQTAVSSSDDQKLLQIWIDNSLVYELEDVQDEKEDWTFAIDLRGVDTMMIYVAEGIKLEDVQIIRQSAEKETETQTVNKNSSNKNNSNKNSKN